MRGGGGGGGGGGGESEGASVPSDFGRIEGSQLAPPVLAIDTLELLNVFL